MSKFYTIKTYEVVHCDGWSYIVSEYEDGLIQVSYRDTPDSKPKPCLEALWPESARAIASALVELADKLEQDSGKTVDPKQSNRTA